MANFSDLVVYALEQLLEIIQEADNAQAEIDDLREYLSDMHTQIESECSNLKQQADSLVEQAEFLNSNLQEQSKITETTLNNIQLKLANLQEQYQQDYENTKNSLITFREAIEISQDEALETLVNSSYVLDELLNQTQETEIEVETSLDKVKEFFDKIIIDILDNNVQKLENKSSYLEELIQQECLDAIGEDTNDFKLSLEKIAEEVESKMNFLEPLNQKSEHFLSPLLDDYQSNLEALINQFIIDTEDKQNHLEDSNNNLISVLNYLDDNYIITDEIATEILNLLNQLLVIKRQYKIGICQ
jgi:chromosome segregation ATPase